MPAFAPDLDALGELAASFARAYPALAPRLAERSNDPDVERLLEAFGYLTARIHKLLDESTSPARSFAALVAPELERGFPSATVMGIAPPPERKSVPAGATFDSPEVGNTVCRFKAWSAFDLVPWSVDDARIAWSSAEGQSLVVRLVAAGAAGGCALASLFPLRLHLAGETRVALALLLYLRTHLARAELRVGDRVFDLGKRIEPWGLDASEALLPPEPYEHPGLRLLREYYLLPAKFAFVTLDGPAVEGNAADVELRFTFDAQLPLELQVSAQNIRLNCVPVANVFETTADPIAPSLERPVHVLRPAGIPLGLGGTYAVTRVLGGRDGTTEEIPPFSSFGAAPPGPAFWVGERHATPRGSEVHLSLGSPADTGPIPAYDYVSVEIQADNGALPNSLGMGDVCMHPEWTVRNIAAVTPYRAPASGDELRYRTLAVLALQAASLVTLDPLRTLLHVLNLHPLHDAQAARANAQRLAAVVSLDVTPSRARPPGAVLLGHDLVVSLSNAGFDGEGDALVFGSVLARLFAHEASVGAFVRTTVRIVETGSVFAFPALHGDRAFEG